jgi:hypothetical protein
MTEPDDPTAGASDPATTTHRPWLRILTAVVLAVFVLATLVGALMV